MTTKKSTTKKTAKRTQGKRGRKPSTPDTAKITLLVKQNPRREGTKAHKRYSLYKSGMTVGEYLKKGGSRGSLRKDVRLKRVKVATAPAKAAPKPRKPSTTKVSESTAPSPAAT